MEINHNLMEPNSFKPFPFRLEIIPFFSHLTLDLESTPAPGQYFLVASSISSAKDMHCLYLTGVLEIIFQQI